MGSTTLTGLQTTVNAAARSGAYGAALPTTDPSPADATPQTAAFAPLHPLMPAPARLPAQH